MIHARLLLVFTLLATTAYAARPSPEDGMVGGVLSEWFAIIGLALISYPLVLVGLVLKHVHHFRQPGFFMECASAAAYSCFSLAWCTCLIGVFLFLLWLVISSIMDLKLSNAWLVGPPSVAAYFTCLCILFRASHLKKFDRACSAEPKAPNKAPEPSPTSVTPPAHSVLELLCPICKEGKYWGPTFLRADSSNSYRVRTCTRCSYVQFSNKQEKEA